MKLFNKKAGNRTVNYSGHNVKFNSCIAEVGDELGKEILELGIADLYEYGKQPVFETPKEIQMKSDFADKEEWYKKELARLTNINTTQKKKIEELEQEIVNWKNEYTKEHEARLALVESFNSKPEASVTEAKEEPAKEAKEEESEVLTKEQELETLKKELSLMKKDELISFGTENGIEMNSVSDKTKAEIIEFLVNATKD